MAKSRVACASFNIGTNTTITITRDVKTYTHTITYKFGNATGTIATKTSNTSIVWSPTASTLYAQIPNAVSGYGTITCETFNGSTSLGTTTAGFYAYAVKSNCLPTVSATIVDTNASTIALTGNSSKLICYISKPKVTMTATAKNSATIKTRQIYNPVGLIATTSPYTFDTVYSKEFRCTATDSRGYSTTKTYNVSFVEYEPCHFTTIPTIKRTESTSTTATLTIKGYCFKGSFGAVSNTLTLKYRYKTSTGSYGSYVSVTPTWNTDGTFTATPSVTGLTLTNNYIFEVIVQDKLTSFGNGETIVLSQGIGDLRICKDYILTKNNLIVGDVNNTAWKNVKVRRKIDNVNFNSNIAVGSLPAPGLGETGSRGTLALLLNKFINSTETTMARYDIKEDGFMYNYNSNMAVSEITSFAPSTVGGGSQGYCLLNGGNADPILFQWGRVNITPKTANVVESAQINFTRPFVGNPFVGCDKATSAPATVFANVGDITSNGFKIYIQRPTATSTSIIWFAVGNGSNVLPE